MSTQRTKGDAPEPRRNHLETHNEGDGSLRFNNDLLPNLGGGLVIKVWDLMSLSSCGGFRVLSLWKIHLTSLSPGSFYFELFILNVTVARIVENTWPYPSLRFTDSLTDVFLVLMLDEWQPSPVSLLSPSGTFGPTGSLHGDLMLEGWEQVGMGEL